MSNKQKSSPYLKRYWVSSIGIFILSQFIFIILETIGWVPNMRDIDGTLFSRIAESSFFKEWFTFYETMQFNLLTVLLGIAFLVPGIISAIKGVLSLVLHK